MNGIIGMEGRFNKKMGLCKDPQTERERKRDRIRMDTRIHFAKAEGFQIFVRRAASFVAVVWKR